MTIVVSTLTALIQTTPMNPDTFQLVVAIVGGLVTVANTWMLFMVKSFSESISSLRATDAGLAERITEMNTLLAGHYVTRTEFKDDIREQTNLLTDAMTRMELRLTERIRGV